MLTLSALLVASTTPGVSPSLRQIMVEHAVGVLRDQKDVYVLRDFTTGRDLATLPHGSGTTQDVAYDAKTHELIEVVSKAHKWAKLYIANFSNSGSRIVWKLKTLPKENWKDLEVGGVPERHDVAGDAVRICLNPKYFMVVYDGPRVRFFDRKSFRNLGETKLGHFVDEMPNATDIRVAAIDPVGRSFAVGVSNRMMEQYLHSDFYCGELGKHFTHNNHGSATGPPCDGVVPLPGGGWAFLLEDSTIRPLFPVGGGRYKRRGRDQQLGRGHLTGLAYDGSTGWGYHIVDRRLYGISLSAWPHIKVVRAGGSAYQFPELGADVFTYAGSKWVLAEGDMGAVMLWKKSPGGRLTYKSSANVEAQKQLVELHG